MWVGFRQGEVIVIFGLLFSIRQQSKDRQQLDNHHADYKVVTIKRHPFEACGVCEIYSVLGTHL